MGERFLLSLCFVLFFSLFCFSLLPCFSILFCRCSSLRSRYSLYISPLYGFNSMQPCVFSFWFNRRTFASMGNFGELMFRYRHFPRFLFSFVVAFFSTAAAVVVRLLFCFAFGLTFDVCLGRIRLRTFMGLCLGFSNDGRNPKSVARDKMEHEFFTNRRTTILASLQFQLPFSRIDFS